MVSNQLFSLGFSQFSQRIISSFKISSHGLESLLGFGFNFISLFSGDESSEGHVSQVSGNSDSCRNTERIIEVFGEVKLTDIPIFFVLVFFFVSMIVFNDLV
jgi:hypothetical protein